VIDFGHLGAQKKLERKHLVAFRRVCTDFPFGRIVSGETPDFVVHRASTKIGIEHTQIYIDDAKKRSSLQSREAAKIKITRLAEKQAQEAGLPNIYVNLFFSRTWSPDPKQDDRIARAVAQTVINNIPPEGESVWVSYRLHSVQPIEVDLISIHRISDFGDERWSCQTEAGEPLKDAVTRIQAAIDSKAGRFLACLQECEACWLLIVAPSWSPAGMVHPDEASLEHTYTSPFTRTHFLNLSYGAAVPLKTEPAAV
jgi:hypothetical protein